MSRRTVVLATTTGRHAARRCDWAGDRHDLRSLQERRLLVPEMHGRLTVVAQYRWANGNRRQTTHRCTEEDWLDQTLIPGFAAKEVWPETAIVPPPDLLCKVCEGPAGCSGLDGSLIGGSLATQQQSFASLKAMLNETSVIRCHGTPARCPRFLSSKDIF